MADVRGNGFWVILAGAVPTAFRSPRREDLVPTLHQLQRTQPDTKLVWFSRGRIWESPEAERTAMLEKRQQRRERKDDWRPGGTHKDPRARYQLTRDQKRARFKQRQSWGPDPRKTETKPDSGQGPSGDKSHPQGKPPYADGPRRDDRPKFGDRRDERPSGNYRNDRPKFGDRHDNRPRFDDRRTDRPKFGGAPGDRPASKFGRPPGKFGRPPGKFGRPPGDSGRPPGKFDRPPGKFGRPPGESGRPPGRSDRPPGKFGRPSGEFGRPPAKSGRPPGKFGRPPAKFGRPPGKFGRRPPPRGPKKPR